MGGNGAPDRIIAALAERQGGVVARRQLLARGVTSREIDRRLAAGRLFRLHTGVYAVGHRVVGATGRRWAAVLACGPGSVLSDDSAGDAWEMRRSERSRIDVTVGRHGARTRPGLRTHRRSLASDEVTELDGLPITTPERTLLDLAASGLKLRQLERALDQAERMRLVDFDRLGDLLERHRGAPGTPGLRTVAARYAGAPVDTCSVLEDLAVELCDAHGIPRPAGNVVVAGWVRDLYWPHARLVVEVDSYAYHRSPSAMSDDRERDVSLTLAGIRPLRFTHPQLTNRRAWVAQSILAMLRGADSTA
jgi:hypothetical protein